jgi:hypothetical protein
MIMAFRLLLRGILLFFVGLKPKKPFLFHCTRCQGFEVKLDKYLFSLIEVFLNVVVGLVKLARN